MKEYKIYTFAEVADRVGLTEEAHRRVRESLRAGDSLENAVRRECSWPEGFLEGLKGKPLEEQMGYYRVVETEVRSRTAYGEITKENSSRFGYALEDYRGLRGLIVEDGVLIGVRIKSAWDPYGDGAVALPYRDVCTYYASDNNGSGSNDREDYAHLCCVMPEETGGNDYKDRIKACLEELSGDGFPCEDWKEDKKYFDRLEREFSEEPADGETAALLETLRKRIADKRASSLNRNKTTEELFGGWDD